MGSEKSLKKGQYKIRVMKENSVFSYLQHCWYQMCGFSILSNSPVLCRPQLGTLQFNSWWQQLPRIRVDPQVKGSVPRLLPLRHQPQVAGCRRYLWLTSHKPRVPRTLSSGSILFWNGSQNSGKHSYQFIMRNTAQERPDGSDAKGNLWEGRPLQAATLLACGRAHQPGISPDQSFRVFVEASLHGRD